MEVQLNNLSLSNGSNNRIKKCQLCDGLNHINWYCVECKMKICDKCKVIHANVRASKNHSIKLLRDNDGQVFNSICNDINCNALDVEMERRVKKQQCTVHPHSTYSSFCKTCNVLVCKSFCVTQNHKNHDLCGINQFVKDRYSKDFGKANFSQWNPANQLPRQENCSYKTSEITPGLNPAHPSRQEDYSYKSEKLQELNPTQLKSQKHCLFESSKKLPEFNPAQPPKQGDCSYKSEKLPELNPALPKSHIDCFYETCEKFPDFTSSQPTSQEDYCFRAPSANFQIKDSLIINLPFIYFIKAVSSDMAWISCTGNKVMKRVALPSTGERINDNVQIDGYGATDMAIIDGRILFSSSSDNNLKEALMDRCGPVRVFNKYNFAPFYPTCIHYERKTNLIWIGLKNSGKDFVINHNSTRKIVAVSETWQPVKTFEYSAGKRLFTLPFRINDIDGQICVVDRTSQTTGRVLALNSQGKGIWEYETPQQATSCGKPFFPTAIATTSKNIVVLDAANKTLHVLDKMGNIFAFYSTTELGIDLPFSLDMDETGQLWIGSKCRCSEQNQSRIFVLKMSLYSM